MVYERQDRIDGFRYQQEYNRLITSLGCVDGDHEAHGYGYRCSMHVGLCPAVFWTSRSRHMHVVTQQSWRYWGTPFHEHNGNVWD